MIIDKKFQIKIKIFKGFWSVDDTRKNPKSLFVFGDNDIKKGKGGQAIIRYEKNSIGIPTKKFNSSNDNAYYTDNEFELNKEKIDKSIKEIKGRVYNEGYEYLILPEEGVGTGRAKLNEKAPKTFEYLQISYSDMTQEFL